jgi:hypothetical protein
MDFLGSVWIGCRAVRQRDWEVQVAEFKITVTERDREPGRGGVALSCAPDGETSTALSCAPDLEISAALSCVQDADTSTALSCAPDETGTALSCGPDDVGTAALSCAPDSPTEFDAGAEHRDGAISPLSE